MSAAVPVLTAASTTGGHPIGVPFGVRRAEHRSPRDPEHDPPLDAEVAAQPFDVADVVIHVDARPMHALRTGVRGAPSRRPLVEEHRPMTCGVEVARACPRCSPSPDRRAGTRPVCRRACRPVRSRGHARRRRRGRRPRTARRASQAGAGCGSSADGAPAVSISRRQLKTSGRQMALRAADVQNTVVTP